MSDELLKFRVDAHDVRIQEIEREIAEFKERQEQIQRGWLTRGIGVLLFVLTTLIGILWNYRSEIFK